MWEILIISFSLSLNLLVYSVTYEQSRYRTRQVPQRDWQRRTWKYPINRFNHTQSSTKAQSKTLLQGYSIVSTRLFNGTLQKSNYAHGLLHFNLRSWISSIILHFLNWFYLLYLSHLWFIYWFFLIISIWGIILFV